MSFKSILKISALGFLYFLLLSPFGARGQINDIPQNVILKTIPQFPGPYQNVMVELQSYTTNLNNENITWSVDDAVVKKGIGEKKVEFITGALGSVSRITVGTSQFSETLQIRPVEADIIWQAKTYTPPFYKGKALFTHQSIVTFVAIPHFLNSNGTRIDPKTLTYKWTKNGTVLASVSGYGKDSVTITGTVIIRPTEIEVEINNSDNTYFIKKGITLQGVAPKIVTYENSPLYGVMYENALKDTVELAGKEIKVSAVPFFFSGGITDPDILYSWKMNGATLGGELGNTLTLRAPEDNNAGRSNITAAVRKSGKIFQSAENSFTLYFKQANE